MNWFSTYTGKYYDTGLTYAAGGFYRVPSTMVHNVSVAYTFEDGKYLEGTRLLVGARNVFDKDPPLVPGVLFCSRPLDFSAPSLLDLAPTILDALGVPVPPEMEGRSLWV